MESPFLTLILYAFWLCLALLCGVLAKTAKTGVEGEGGGFWSIILMIICIILGLFCLSPIVYEYPSFFDWHGTTVLERTDGRHFIDHPKGVFCLEGNSRFFTAPIQSDSLKGFSSIKNPSTGKIEYVDYLLTITDYGKLFSDSGIKTNFDYTDAMIDAIRHKEDSCFQLMMQRIPELAILCQQNGDDGISVIRSQTCYALLEIRMNELLSGIGLRYHAVKPTS